MMLAQSPFFHKFTLFVWTKLLFGFLMILSVITTFYIQLKHFNTTDPVPEFLIIDEAKQKEFGAFTVKVQTGLFIKNFPVFDMIKNNFSADCIIWFEFNSDEITLDTIGKFSFESGKIAQISSPDIRIDGNKTFVKYDVRAEFKSNLNYYKFPFEDHRISLVLSNTFVTPQEMYYQLNETAFSVNKNIFISNWVIRDLNTDTGYSNPKLDTHDESKQTSYPQAAFILNFAKGGIRKVLIIYIPLFFGLLLSLCSFLMSLNNTVGRITLAISAVTALLGYRFVIEQMMPEVGYFTTTDSMYSMLFFTAFLVFMFQLLITRYTSIELEKKPDPQSKTPFIPIDERLYRFEVINMLCFVGLVILITGATVWIVLF